MIAGTAGRRAAVPAAVALALLVVYGSTLARDVTFWDAGEFIAAASAFGIPHPPGTPLYVALLRTAMVLLGALGVTPAVATTIVSAAGTAAACAAGAAIVHRATGDAPGATAGGIASGTMASVWLNATETEVYAVSLALSLAMVWCAERAGREASLRWSVVVAYLAVLAVPLHLSALLAAPAAVWLAAGSARPAWNGDALTRAAIVGAGAAAAFALGRMTIAPAVAALLMITAASVLTRTAAARTSVGRWRVPLRVALLPAAVLIGASALAILLVRAQFDPAVNQGNPATLAALVEVVARRQYDVAALWPRQAPAWLQVGNLGLYADWQVARSLGPTIFPTVLRTSATLLFALLGGWGAWAHWQRDRRTAMAMGLLLLAGTLGAVAYLNLRAGPSFGHGILPDGAVREARERDYFFVLGWWTWGIWAGVGAVALARRAGAPVAAGVALALLPLALNWREVDRTRLPDAALARATAEGLLGHAPPRAVLFVAGDNDTYPLWYAQQSLGMRRDVAVVTMPLLPADWYRQELARRDSLFVPQADGSVPWRGRATMLEAIVAQATRAGRPVATAASVSARDRATLGEAWILRGPVFVASAGDSAAPAIMVDTVAAARWQERLAALTGGRPARVSIDGTSRYIRTLLGCPELARGASRNGLLQQGDDTLARHCNFR